MRLASVRVIVDQPVSSRAERPRAANNHGEGKARSVKGHAYQELDLRSGCRHENAAFGGPTKTSTTSNEKPVEPTVKNKQISHKAHARDVNGKRCTCAPLLVGDELMDVLSLAVVDETREATRLVGPMKIRLFLTFQREWTLGCRTQQLSCVSYERRHRVICTSF